MWSEILIVVALVLLNGVFAMSELALVSSRPAELRRRALNGSAGAKAALELLADPSRMLSAVQVGITMVGIVAGAYSGTALGGRFGLWLAEHAPMLTNWSHEIAMTVVVGLISYLSLVVGELVPKRLAMGHSEAIAVRVAPLMRWVSMAGGPVVTLLQSSTDALLQVLGQRQHQQRAVTHEEVRAVIAEGAVAGIIAPDEKLMLDRVMRLADRPAGSLMTPRPEVVWLDADAPLAQWRERIAGAPHSRFPVARGSLDELIGILDARLILDQLLNGQPFDPLAAVREAPAVHEDTPSPRILEMFRRSGAPMAVVLNEYGGLEGIITITDILEAITGEISNLGQDDTSAVRRDDGSWLMDGLIPIVEAEALTGLSGLGKEGDFHTLAGFVLARLAHLPRVGEHFSWNGWRFEVVDMDGRRIDRVLLEPLAAGGDTSDSGV